MNPWFPAPLVSPVVIRGAPESPLLAEMQDCGLGTEVL